MRNSVGGVCNLLIFWLLFVSNILGSRDMKPNSRKEEDSQFMKYVTSEVFGKQSNMNSNISRDLQRKPKENPKMSSLAKNDDKKRNK